MHQAVSAAQFSRASAPAGLSAGDKKVASADHQIIQEHSVAIARLEEQQAAHERADAKAFESIDAQLKSMATTLDSIDHRLGKQKGFIAGAMFVVTGILGVIGMALTYWVRPQ